MNNKDLNESGGADTVEARGVVVETGKYFQWYNPVAKTVKKEEDATLFRVPLCRWYPTSVSSLTSSGTRTGKVGDTTAAEGAVYQS